MPFDPNDRFQVVEAPQLAPGCCTLCRSVTRGPFVDTGHRESWNNHVFYLCFGCLHDIVDNLPEEFKNVVEILVQEKAEEAYERAKSEIALSINVLLSTLVPVRVDPDSDTPGGSPIPDGEGMAEDPIGAEGSKPGSDSTSGQGSSNNRSKRRVSVPGDSGDEPGDLFGFGDA